LKYFLSQRTVEYIREKTGTATVLKVFDIKKIGIIAGCYVKDGLFVRKGIVVAIRNGSKVGEGKITSLQREKKTVKEVHAGFECGFMAQGFQEWQEGDTVECYIEVPKK
jgi:translation initiation factor IF-2